VAQANLSAARWNLFALRAVNAKTVLAWIAVAVATVVYFMPPPAGFDATMMHAAALVILAVGLWAVNVFPEHVTGLVFLLVAMLLAVAPASVVFNGFTSTTLWLVFGGLFMAEAVRATGLGERLARLLLDRFTGSYPAVIVGVVVVSTALSFVMPATMSRVLLLIPIFSALATRMGFKPGSEGHYGIVLTMLMTTYQVGTGILPANAPNLVLAGAAETLYQVPLIYGEYLWVQFPVLGVLKAVALAVLTLLIFPATPQPSAERWEMAPMSAPERRLVLILAAALLFWVTDFLHGIKPGWVALAAGLACMMPVIGVIPMTAFNERVRYGPFFYVGAILGLGSVMNETGLAGAIGLTLANALDMNRGEDLRNFVLMSVLATLAGLFTTNPSQPALLAPLAAHAAEAAGWPIKAALMTLAVGFSTMILPHQVPPVVVGLHVANIPFRVAMRYTLPIAGVSLFILLPIDYLWWRLIGYFG
jgi:anion transporter